MKTLKGFGFNDVEAEVYIYLAKRGPGKVNDIAPALKIRRRQLYHVLKTLKEKGVVIANTEQPASFFALAFEEALDLLVEANIEQAKVIKETKEELLSSWRSMIKREYT
jgi:sugar-specific transcriptional regulator TrmB